MFAFCLKGTIVLVELQKGAMIYIVECVRVDFFAFFISNNQFLLNIWKKQS